jgi:hypothetical protein
MKVTMRLHSDPEVRECKQFLRGLVQKNDWPRFTEEEPEVYEKEELEKFFKACEPEKLRVTHKLDRGWTPKAYKET